MTSELHKITVAVVSDLHFCNQRSEGQGSELSHIVLQKLQEDSGKNPWSDLVDLIRRNEIKVDLLLCPGDITTHAQHEPLKAAWKGLVSLGKELDASLVACATGNHDVSSRIEKGHGNPVHEMDNPSDFFENLKLLSPEYPLQILKNIPDNTQHRRNRIQYFGADFLLHEDEHYRLIIFNSCARHTNDQAVFERGAIAESTLIELREQLKLATTRKINLFVCHHHPVVHTQDGKGTYDFLQRGDELIQLLQDNGDWIIIHGHKHDGRIIYAPTGAPGSAPVIFSASSVGAILSKDNLNNFKNQFYILDIFLPTRGCSLGSVKAWNWHFGEGWSQAIDPRVGLISGTGFGERTHSDDLAERIATDLGDEPVPWEEIVSKFSFVRHLTPGSLKELIKSLRNNHDIVHLPDEKTHQILSIGLENK